MMKYFAARIACPMMGFIVPIATIVLSGPVRADSA